MATSSFCRARIFTTSSTSTATSTCASARTRPRPCGCARWPRPGACTGGSRTCCGSTSSTRRSSPISNLQVFRLLGPNLHSISYAYALAFFATMLLGQKRPLYLLSALPLLLVIGSKGALICCATALVGLVAVRLFPPRLVLTALVAAFGVYGATS